MSQRRSSRRRRPGSARRSRSASPAVRDQQGLSSYQHRAKSLNFGADALQRYAEQRARSSPVNPQSGTYETANTTHYPASAIQKVLFDEAYENIRRLTPKKDKPTRARSASPVQMQRLGSRGDFTKDETFQKLQNSYRVAKRSFREKKGVTGRNVATWKALHSDHQHQLVQKYGDGVQDALADIIDDWRDTKKQVYSEYPDNKGKLEPGLAESVRDRIPVETPRPMTWEVEEQGTLDPYSQTASYDVPAGFTDDEASAITQEFLRDHSQQDQARFNALFAQPTPTREAMLQQGRKAAIGAPNAPVPQYIRDQPVFRSPGVGGEGGIYERMPDSEKRAYAAMGEEAARANLQRSAVRHMGAQPSPGDIARQQELQKQGRIAAIGSDRAMVPYGAIAQPHFHPPAPHHKYGRDDPERAELEVLAEEDRLDLRKWQQKQIDKDRAPPTTGRRKMLKEGRIAAVGSAEAQPPQGVLDRPSFRTPARAVSASKQVTAMTPRSVQQVTEAAEKSEQETGQSKLKQIGKKLILPALGVGSTMLPGVHQGIEATINTMVPAGISTMPILGEAISAGLKWAYSEYRDRDKMDSNAKTQELASNIANASAWSEANFGRLTAENKVTIKKMLDVWEKIRDRDKPKVPQIADLRNLLSGQKRMERTGSGSRLKQGGKEFGKAAMKLGPGVISGMGATGPVGAALATTGALIAGRKELWRGAKAWFRGLTGAATPSEAEAHRMARYLNTVNRQVQHIPGTELNEFDERLRTWKKLAASEPPYELPYLNTDFLEKQLEQRLKDDSQAMTTEQWDKLLTGDREFGAKQVRGIQERREKVRQREAIEYDMGSPKAAPEASPPDDDEKKQPDPLPPPAGGEAENPLAELGLATIPEGREKGFRTPRGRERSITKDMSEMQEAMAQMQAEEARRTGSAPDPDRPRPGTQEEIPSQDMAKGEIPEYNASREETFEQGTKNMTESKPRPDPKGTPMYRPRPLRLRGGAGTPRPPGPSNPASAGGTPMAGTDPRETAGPNTNVPVREILRNIDLVGSQMRWLMDNSNQQSAAGHRNLRALSMHFKKMGGDLNEFVAPTGAREEETREKPADQSAAQRRNRRQDTTQLLQQLRRFAETGQRPAVATAQPQPTMVLPQQPRVVTQTQTIPIPIPMGGAPQRGQPSGVVVKQTVKQQQNAQAKTKRGIRKRQQGTLGKSRKEYNALKKQVKARITKAKKAFYDVENKKIMGMKRGQRKAAREKLRAAIKSKLAKLMAMVKPSSSLKTMEAVAKAISVIKKLKW